MTRDIIYIDVETFTSEDWMDMIIEINEELDNEYGYEEVYD